MGSHSKSHGCGPLNFGSGFLGLKALSLATRSLLFFIILGLSEKAFGANHLISFLSWVTVLGIALGFGSSDSVTVSSDVKAARISRIVFWVSIGSVGTVLLLLIGSYWINVLVACFSYGLSFWNLGLVRRRNPVLFEKILNFQMLAFWCLYLMLLPVETSDLRILSSLYVFMNGLLALTAFKEGNSTAHFEPTSKERSVRKVSLNKLVWEINYSALTRMPFLLTTIAASMHAAFSYAYLLCEMTSAMLSHHQTIFLKSKVPDIRAWIRIGAILLAGNAVLLVALLVALQYQHIVIDPLTDLLGLQLGGISYPLVHSDILGLAIFVLAISAFQIVSYGRYAIKLEADARLGIIVTAVSVCSFAISGKLSVDYYLNYFAPFAIMLIAGFLLILVILRRA